MPTEKQSAASRANSQHSTGPRTTEGRANSRFNALKHGVYAESQIIFNEHYNPADPAERCLVDALIETEWRQRRMRRVEACIWEDKRSSLLRYKTIMEDDPRQRVVTPGEVFCNDDAKFASLQRVVSSCHRDFRAALKELRRLQSATGIPACRPATPEPNPVELAFPPASATGIPACRPATPEPNPAEPAFPPASVTGIPACRPATETPASQPEQTKATSESPASFPNNSQPLIPTIPETQPTAPEPAPTPDATLPKAA